MPFNNAFICFSVSFFGLLIQLCFLVSYIYKNINMLIDLISTPRIHTKKKQNDRKRKTQTYNNHYNNNKPVS